MFYTINDNLKINLALVEAIDYYKGEPYYDSKDDCTRYYYEFSYLGMQNQKNTVVIHGENIYKFWVATSTTLYIFQLDSGKAQELISLLK